MKKKLRKTGEVVDVIDFCCILIRERNDDDWVSYIDSKGVEHHTERGLNIYWDFEDVEEELTKEIDWEQRRFELIKSAIQGFCANSEPSITQGTTFQQLAEWSIEMADIIIVELRKGGQNGQTTE